MAADRQQAPHSAEFFGPERDYWWNADYLELIAARFELETVRSVLDVGCGVGHWGRLIGSLVAPEAMITGVDREQAWVREAAAIADRAGLARRYSYQPGTVEALPFPDASFDLVTCQTVLIHVASPRSAVKEMLRVSRPGGLILVAEPNNRASVVVDTSLTADAPLDELLERLRFVLTLERGKIALGEGNNSAGDLLPGLFAEEGIENVQTFMSDCAAALVPPYDTAAQRALRSYAVKHAADETWGWSREDANRYHAAGGGSKADFDTAWQKRIEENREAAAALTDGSFHTAGANVLYVIAGRKPG
jgi:SAM-dependent methyltransferase